MIIIVGLGNPSKKYQFTRHNIGFLVVEEFRKKNNFANFKFSRKFNALISEGFLNNKKIILAKPQTFMNLSGKAVKALIGLYQIKPVTNFGDRLNKRRKLEMGNLIVIHDDIDIPLGKIRIVKNRGAAGHKGVESIIKELKTKNFVRFRIGVRPKNSTFQTIVRNVEKFVLEKFIREEEKTVKEVIKKSCQAIKMVLKEGLEKAMARTN